VAAAGRDAYLVELRDAGILASPAPDADHGLVLASRWTPRRCSTRRPSSRRRCSISGPVTTFLDACATPGGKAAHVLEMSPAARLVAVDKDPADW
jgi:16S rRNA (cytosine967-C5)-methyltransferase